ncbi:MAG: transketolase [Chlamydiota bacterium]|nr:transketolase [Chlamydiota bacterium]
MDSTNTISLGDSTKDEYPHLDAGLKDVFIKTANAIRVLSMDAVQKANSGHPGLPLGCAEIGAYLYGHVLNHNPTNPKWLNRDRFILSAGHGSMWLYSCLHLSGFKVSLEDIKNFRQLHSITPGHPESLDTEGVETTTGPLGQGIGNAVGQALGLKILADRFNTQKHKIFDNKVYCLMGDGCVMEGISAEVSSLAGHLKLDNLIVIYDANNISLDGPLDESCSENTKERYKSYGWEVVEVDGHDFDAIHQTFSKVRDNQKRPTLIIAHTIIGRGSPNKAGTHKVHGSPLGEEEILATKQALGLPEEPFWVAQSVYDFFEERLKKDRVKEEEWKTNFDGWAQENPDLFKMFEDMTHHRLPKNLEDRLSAIEINSPIAGRKASNTVLQNLATMLPQLIGGSADLSCSDLTMLKEFPVISPGIFTGKNIKFGVREFGMAAMATGLAQTQMLTPYIGTFLTFSDYMRNAIRLCSLMKEKVIYQFTHDSVFLGEDGPTHQPVEHYAALRAIPNLHFIRPADANEVKMAWIAALRYQGPTAFSLSRQSLPTLTETNVAYSEGMGRGAYIIRKEKQSAIDYTLVATGSEVSLALDVAKELEKIGKSVRVISFPCWEIFELQEQEYKESIFGGDLGKRVSIEAGVEQGWHKYIGSNGIAICMESFGLSAPQQSLAEEFGFNVASIMERIL